MFDLSANTVFVTLAGSQAHGTAHADSDLDVRGVCVVPLAHRLSLFERFEQHEGPLEGPLLELVQAALIARPSAARGLAVKAECVVFDVAKFLGLCAEANPNTLEILFADTRDWLFETPTWRRIHKVRHQFLSQKLEQTFVGYAMSQLKRLKTHRAWLLHPPKKRPSREDFGLPDGPSLGRDELVGLERRVQDKLHSYGLGTLELPAHARVALQGRMVTFWKEVLETSEDELEQRMRAVATGALSLPADVVATLSAEKRYLGAMKLWRSYQVWKSQRNKARARLEALHGYDTKHAMHLIRVLRMGLEALHTGDLRVRRSDAAELAAIRDGALSFEALLHMINELRAELLGAAETTGLPRLIDRDFVNGVAFEVMERWR